MTVKFFTVFSVFADVSESAEKQTPKPAWLARRKPSKPKSVSLLPIAIPLAIPLKGNPSSVNVIIVQ